MKFFSSGWITKAGGLLTLVGGMLTANGDTTYGPAIIGIGGLITSFAARQVNQTSEDVGIVAPAVIIKVEPPIVVVEKAPLPLSAKENRALRE